MATPTTRSQLKDYCLRRLGFPVIDINVDDDQLEDRIDDALQLFSLYHYDGTEKCYLSQQVTSADINNKYLQLADSILSVTKVFPFTGTTVGGSNATGFNMFDINYQLRLNDFYNLTSSSYTYYVIAREHLEMLNLIITGNTPFTYNKKNHKLNIIQDWTSKIHAGEYIAFECYRIVDPEEYENVFNDNWLKEYTTQIFKKQWGENLKKYGNYTLPGGIVINGQQIWNEAVEEVERLEQKLRDTYEEPAQFIVG